MKKVSCLLGSVALLLTSLPVFSQISGSVFRDFNANGIKNNSASFNEPFVAGITVRAYNSLNVLVATATTTATGPSNYSLGVPAGAYRVEFSGLISGDYSSFSGTGNGTSVQFITAPNAAVNYAINAPDDYWDNVNESNPVLAVTRNKRGRHNGFYNGFASIVQINNNTQSTSPAANASEVTIDTGQTVAARRAATYAQTGSLFGMAYQQKSQRTFSTAVLKRGHGFGPQGAGGIYIATKGATYLSYSASFTLQGVTPSNGGPALDFGSVTRVLAANPTSPTALEMSNNNYLSGIWAWSVAGGSDSRDNDAFAKVGKMSYGDIEADKATDKLYTINLFQRRLIVLDIENTATATLNNATAATLSPLVRAYDLTTLPGWPAATGAGNVVRPYAVKVYKGVGYIGAVSDGSSTQSEADVDGYVLTFDPNNISAGLTTVLTIDFNQYGLLYGFQGFHMGPWANTWAQAMTRTGAGAPGPVYYAQPMIAGFEFNEDGSMDIAIRDRWGDQGAAFEFTAITNSADHLQTVTMGDLLHVTRSGSSWVIENNTTQPAGNTNGATATNSFGEGSSFGSTGKEFYADRSGDGMPENNQAGVTKLMGSDRIITTVVDPCAQGADVSGTNYWSTQGVQWNNTTTGAKTQWARLEGDASTDKSNGMGDIEFLTAGQAIQVGNRIWLDANGNGVQDAGETNPGVPAGTTVTLRSPGSDGTFGNGDDQTWTTTTDANGNYYFSALSSSDNRKPATWTGVGNTLLPGYNYRIEVAIPSGSLLTIPDAVNNGFDNIDNDASVNGTNAVVVFNTANTNHNFDIGFKTLASIGDKVWRDDDNDGTQDTGEPGVAGITVELYQNGTDGLPGTADDVKIGTTITDAYGNYLFDNLTPTNQSTATTIAQTSFNVKFTLPANYTFTPNGTAGDNSNNTNSDATPSTGRTGSYNLTSGETDLTVDAGIIFAQPSTASVGDKVWLDTDNDGVQDAAESGVAGVTVTLYNNAGVAIASTVTDANGNYIFTNLTPGTCSVGFTLPAGFNFGTKDAGGNDDTDSDVNTTGVNFGKTDAFTLSAGENKTNVDAGLVAAAATTASVGDKVWLDLDQDGIQDAGEPGVPGVTVTLYQNGSAIASTVTDVFGNYIFNNLPAGTGYQVGVTLPGGYTVSPADTGADNATDSDIQSALGNRTSVFSLAAGTRNLTLDAGIYQTAPAGTASVGDTVWFDADGDGVQDAGEAGVPGVVVTLYNNSGTAIATTTTDANGKYLFPNLAAGNYSVGFSNFPPGYGLTGQDIGGDDNADSDANPATGRTVTFALASGENKTNVDAGLVAGQASGLGSLGNKVWYDLDNDGIQDAGELGVPGVTVTLQKDINGDGDFADAGEAAFATAVTNSLGEYIFSGLDAGSYRVQFSNLPAGYSASPQNAGTDDKADSDGSAISGGISTTGVYTLGVGEDNLTVDFGINNPARNTLGNIVWLDADNDGTQDAGEPGVAGVMVSLYNDGADGIAGNADDQLMGTTSTDMNGNYLFSNLADDTYYVKFSNIPAGLAYTGKDAGGNDGTDSDADRASGFTGTYTLNAGNRTDLTVDGGLVSTRAALGNYVWLDADGDGVQDAAETGVPGVTVSLYYDANGDGDYADAGENLPVASMITDQNGQYLFTNLIPGNYQVAFSTIPSGLVFTQQNTPGDNGDNTNSDAAKATGRTATIALAAGETDLSVDAGLYKPQASVGNYVWVDTNSDGDQDANEPGIAGVLVTLVDVATGQPVAVTVTDGNGGYLFPNVAPGTYYIQFGNLPTGATFTTQDQAGGNDNLDSDVNPGTGRTANFAVPASGVNLTFDAGVITNISILPVKLEFTAVKRNAIATLNWKVTGETGVRAYSVERSADGRSFTAIAELTANGAAIYTADDQQPLAGLNYYRIKITNQPGSIEYSDVRVLNFGKQDIVNVFPNPAKDAVSITLPENWQGQSVQLELYNTSGQQMLKKTQSSAAQVISLDVQAMPSGIYYLRIVAANTDAIVKQVSISH